MSSPLTLNMSVRDDLCDLAPFAQFKKTTMKNNHGGVIVLVKLQAIALLITLFLQVPRIFKLHTKH